MKTNLPEHDKIVFIQNNVTVMNVNINNYSVVNKCNKLFEDKQLFPQH